MKARSGPPIGPLVVVLLAGVSYFSQGIARAVPPAETSHQGARATLATDRVVITRVSDPRRQVAYCPALEVLSTGRYVATTLLHDSTDGAPHDWLVRVFTSDDRGRTWTHRKDLPMVDGQPFAAGDTVYVIGGREDLFVSRSDDGGTTWSDLVALETGRTWYAFPGQPLRRNGRIYLEKECRTEPIPHGFPVWILAPVVMSAPLDADLTQGDAWTFSSELSFRDVVERYGAPNLLGAPFHLPKRAHDIPAAQATRELGWGEGNLIEIHDPAHVWHDPNGRTLHILLRAETGRSGLAALAKAVESVDGTITVDLERAPSGEPILYLPLPGGQGAFNIVFDEETGLYWLGCSHSADSMRKPELLDPWHYGRPYNERTGLDLYYSKNCADWTLAGRIVDAGGAKRSFFHGSTVIDGDDLVIVMREADQDAVNAHNSNMITFHRVPDFRRLAEGPSAARGLR